MRRCRHRWSVLCTKAPPPLLAEGAAARRGLRIRVGASMGPRSTPRVPGNRKAAHPCPAAIGNRSPRRILHPTSIASTLAGAEPWNRREARVAALSPLCRPVPKGNDSGPRRFVRDDPTPSAVGGCPVTSPAEGRAHTRTGIRRQAKRDPWRFSTRRFKISELLAWLLSPRRRGWHMPLQPHIDDDVPVVFVVVGDVEHQNRTTDRLCRSHPDTSGHVDHLIEVGVGRLFVRAVAERQRIVQRLYEGSLRGDLFVIADGRDLLATSLRAKEQIGGDDVPNELAKCADLWRRLELVLLCGHGFGRFRKVSSNRRVHCLSHVRE